MSQTSLQDLIGSIKTTYKETYEKAATQDGPDSAWDGPDLPENLEYRVMVDKAEYKASNAGNMQFVLTYEIQEPVEFKGRKLQSYRSPHPRNEKDSEMLAKFFGVFKARLDGWGDDMEEFVQQFEGKTAVITVRKWGSELDRFGVRWENADRGQTLSTTIAPQKVKADTKNLRPDIQLLKDKGEEPFPPGQTTPPPAAATPTTGGPNLPPGLQ